MSLQDENERLKALKGLQILDTEPEEEFDALTDVALGLTGAKSALVSLVDRDRQWFKSRQNLDAAETPRDIAFCHHAIESPDLFYVYDALEDPRFKDNPLVTDGPKIRTYAGIPLH